MKKIIAVLLVTVFLSGCGFIREYQNKMLVNQDNLRKKEINQLIDNFTEQFIHHFNLEEEEEGKIISFGVFNNYRHNIHLFEVASNNEHTRIRINAKYIDGTIKTFFNKRIDKHQSGYGYEYVDGYYQIPVAMGEATRFVQVKMITSTNNAVFIIRGDVYADANNLGYKVDWYEPIHNWPKEQQANAELAGTFTATIQEIKENGVSRNILLKYDEQELVRPTRSASAE